MLGELVAGLTNSKTAADIVSAIASSEILDRIHDAAAQEDVAVGTLVSSRVRHVIEHGGEDVWLDLVGVMTGSPQPGAAAVQRVLAYAFPDPVRVRIKRSGG